MRQGTASVPRPKNGCLQTSAAVPWHLCSRHSVVLRLPRVVPCVLVRTACLVTARSIASTVVPLGVRRNWCCSTCILDLLALLEAIRFSHQLPLDGAIYSVRSHQQTVAAKLVIVKRERRVVCSSTFWSIFDPLWVVFFFVTFAGCS
eukprot:SAG11_NODE_11918_length_731_cov_2.186709_2_plen_147_part_00